MRNKIFGGIGVLWGSAILVSGFLRGGPEASGAYAAGHFSGLVFGLGLLLVGGDYLLKGKPKRA